MSGSGSYYFGLGWLDDQFIERGNAPMLTVTTQGPLIASPAFINPGDTLDLNNTALNSIATRSFKAGDNSIISADSVAIGDGARAYIQSVSIGSGAGSSLLPGADYNVFVGRQSGFGITTADFCTMLGTGAYSSTNSSEAVSIGYNADSAGVAATSVGTLSFAQGNRAVVLGARCESTQADTINIGGVNVISGARSIALAFDKTISGADSFCVFSGTASNNAIILGPTSVANNYGITLGTNNGNITAGDHAILLGRTANGGNFSISAGFQPVAGLYGLSLGVAATSAIDGISCGRQAFSADYAIALGSFANALGQYSITLGANAQTSAAGGVTIGHAATNTSGIVIGENATGSSGLVIGDSASSTYGNVVVVGNSSTAVSGSTALGDSSHANFDNSTAIGRGISTTRSFTTLIGNSVVPTSPTWDAHEVISQGYFKSQRQFVCSVRSPMTKSYRVGESGPDGTRKMPLILEWPIGGPFAIFNDEIFFPPNPDNFEECYLLTINLDLWWGTIDGGVSFFRPDVALVGEDLFTAWYSPGVGPDTIIDTNYSRCSVNYCFPVSFCYYIKRPALANGDSIYFTHEMQDETASCWDKARYFLQRVA